MTLEQRIPLLRDLTCLAAGATGFAWCLATHAPLPPLLVSAALMAGPSVVHLWLAGHIPGGGLSSVPASPEPPPPSSSRSPVPSGGDR